LTLAESSTELVEQAEIRQLVIPENVKEMLARWEVSNLDLKSVVKDALKSGRLPLAVHQLRLLHQKKIDMAISSSDEKSCNAFNEVREIGISIAYDLFVQVENFPSLVFMYFFPSLVFSSPRLKNVLFFYCSYIHVLKFGIKGFVVVVVYMY
jgi:hypothetical protein